MPLWGQTTPVSGKILDKDGKPIVGAQIVYTSVTTKKSFKVTTDKNGEFVELAVPYGSYHVEVMGPGGESLFQQETVITLKPESHRLVVNFSQPDASKPALTPEQIEALKQKNSQAKAENDQIIKYQAAVQDKKWQDAESIAGQLIALDPNRWEYQKSLADAQFNLGKYEDALATYKKAIAMTQNAGDPATTKIAVAQMLTQQGNACLKLKKTSEAVEAFTQAAEMSTNPGTAYFNICAVMYNAGNMEGALAACNKAIAADPNKADAYFIKGSLLFSNSNTDAQGKLIAPPGTVEAFNKYLELAPNGSHVDDVKQMLDAVGVKIETTYKEKKK